MGLPVQQDSAIEEAYKALRVKNLDLEAEVMVLKKENQSLTSQLDEFLEKRKSQGKSKPKPTKAKDNSAAIIQEFKNMLRELQSRNDELTKANKKLKKAKKKTK